MLLPHSSLAGAYYNQNFDSWSPTTTTAGIYYYDGWCVSNGVVSPYNAFTWPHQPYSSPNSAAVKAENTSDRNSVISPRITNGIGNVSFYYRGRYINPITFEVQTSTNNMASWTTNAILGSTETAWTFRAVEINTYATNVYVRIEKTGGGSTAHWLFFDDIDITLPPAYVNIQNIHLTPSTPITDTAQTISAQIIPQWFASNIRASVYYSTNQWSSSAVASLTHTGNNYYATSPAIPSMDKPGLTVQYYIQVILDGPTTNAAANYWPTGAPTSKSSYMLRARPLNSSYANMNITGPPSTNMQLIADYVWRGATVKNAGIDPQFNFQSDTTTWGDPDQSSTTLPITGIAATSGTIDVTGNITNRLEFIFNETSTNNQYSIQFCEYVYFDDWSGATAFGTRSNSENWSMYNSRTTDGTETNKAFTKTGLSAVLQGASNGYLRTPFLPNGIGSVSFRYRAWDETGAVPVKIAIEKSPDGSTWTPVTIIENILSPDYLFESINIADNANWYVRILNASSNITHYLCLDDVSVTRPGALVVLTNPTRTPASPSYAGQPVNVTIDFTDSGGATNLVGKLYWKSLDATDYDFSFMTIIGNTFHGTIPPSIPGTVNYYFECEYEGFNAAPAQYPNGGPAAPLAFTASSNFETYRLQAFDSWPAQTATGVYYFENWCVSNGVIRPYNAFTWPFQPNSPTQSAAILAEDSEDRTSVISPLLSNGVSLVTFYYRTRYNGSVTFEVQTSTDNRATWSTNAIIVSTDQTAWVAYSVDINSFVDTYVRIEKTGGGIAGQYLFFDDIVCAPPSANVVITNLFLAPGYPGTGDTVSVSCDIYTANELFKSYNYRPKVAYRPRYGNWTTNAMYRAGTNNTWTGTIPPQPPDTVEYFIRVDFAGFHYTNSTLSASRSPAFHPYGPSSQNQPDSFMEFVPRRFLSEYSSLSVSSSVGNASMSLIGDNLWQGIFNSTQSTQMLVNFSALGYFTGSGYSATTNYWGDNGQNLFDTPLSGVASTNGTTISININTGSLSQIMFRLNTATGIYEVRRCAYQDFNAWRATTNYFNRSLNLTDQLVFTNNFDAWLTNTTYVTGPVYDQANFQDPDWYPAYKDFTVGPISPLASFTDDGYYVENFRIVQEIGSNNAAEFDRRVYTEGATWQYAATLTKGLEKLDWRARCRFEDNYNTYFTNGFNWTNYSITATMNATNGAGWPRMSILAHYQNESNYYECAVQATNGTSASYDLGIFRVVNGTRTRLNSQLRGGSISNDMTVTFKISPDAATTRLQAISSPGSGNFTVLDPSTALKDGGTIGFKTDDTAITVFDVAVSNHSYRTFDGWNTGTWVASTNVQDWAYTWVWARNNWLSLSNGMNAAVITPYQANPPATFSFQHHNWNTGTTNCIVEGSNDKISWTKVRDITDVANAWRTATITTGISGWRYLRIRHSDPVGTLLLDNIWIESSPPFYTNNFSSGTAANWVAPYGYWFVQNNSYKRRAYCGPRISFRLDKSYDPTLTVGYPIAGWQTVANYTMSNNVWQAFSRNFYFWDKLFTRITHTAGDAAMRVDDVTMHSWRATNYVSAEGLTNGWVTIDGWLTQPAPGNRQLELWRTRADPDTNQSFRTPLMTNGIGRIMFDYKFDFLSGTNGSFVIELAPGELFTPTNTVTSVNTNWNQVDFAVNKSDPMYARIRHTSTTNQGNIRLTIDNFMIEDYTERDERTWEVYNVLITHGKDEIEFEPTYEPAVNVQTAYLNNNPSNDVYGGFPLTLSVPYIQSGKVNEGIGLISFWYRSWETTNASANPGKIRIYAAPDENTPVDNWQLIDQIPAVNNTAYNFYQKNFYNLTNYFVRITSSTNPPDARVAIDNVTIAEPLAASLTIQSIDLTPEAPLYNSDVKVSARLGRFILAPSNIQAKVYYQVGTNDWANLSKTWNTNTNFRVLDQVVSNSPYGMILQSSTGIQIPTIDTVVQYYIECTFDGLFSQYSSPKIGRVFTNPAWYEPINLNVGKPVTNPYYIVFSCPTNAVWINEFNYMVYQDSLGDHTNEFVEIAGVSGSDISNWKIELVDTAVPENIYDYTVVSNGFIIPNTTTNQPGFGFFVWGDTNISAINQAFTNALNDNIKPSGAVRLLRSMGAWADRVAYGSGVEHFTNNGYTYAGSKGADMSSLFLAGTGSNKYDFMWTRYSDEILGLDPMWDIISFAGIANGFSISNHQAFITTVIPGYSIAIVNFWTTSTNTWLVIQSTATNEITPQTWYTTNLINTNWVNIVGPLYNYTPISNTYTQWFDNVPNPPPVYFRVTSTNAP